MMKFWQWLLYPLAWIYGAITRWRNWLYDSGRFVSMRFTVPMISVGNLTVGGTGKTPHIEYLIRYFLKKTAGTPARIATLSRGYGRKTKGFRIANAQDTAQSIGDEPLQFYRKFGEVITVAVGERRAEAVPHILFEQADTALVLLDDAFQHRAVNPDVNILLTDYGRLFYQDLPFPAGRLREARIGARRADAVIVSKCPLELDTPQRADITTAIRRYTKADTPVWFTSLHYGTPIGITLAASPQKLAAARQVVLYSGIAQGQPFEDFVRSQYTVLSYLQFADHHHYNPQDYRKIIARYHDACTPDTIILTTEKDSVKLYNSPALQLFRDIPMYYLPIEVVFLEAEAEFLAWLQERVSLTHED